MTTQTPDPNVKPCPFGSCGSTKIEAVSSGHKICFMECVECGASGPVAEGYDEAVKLWNNRMGPKALP